MTLQEQYEKQKEINKELVDENEALKFAARMSEKVEKQLREENEKLKELIEQMQDAKCISCTDLGGMLLKITDLEKENTKLKSVAEFQQSSNMKRHFEIQKLVKENTELKAGRLQWHLTKNELPELQTATDTGDEYNTLVLCFWYHTDSRGKKTKVYDLDRWYPENDIWESGKQRDEVEAWMYLPEPPEEI